MRERDVKLPPPESMLPRRITEISITVRPIWSAILPSRKEFLESEARIHVKINGQQVVNTNEIFLDKDDFNDRFHQWLVYAAESIKFMLEEERAREKAALDSRRHSVDNPDNSKPSEGNI